MSGLLGAASIERRLTLILAGIAALLACLSWAMVTSFAREAAERTQDNVLSASAATIAEAVRSEQGVIRLELPYSAFAMLGAVGEDRVFYRIQAGGETLTGYGDLAPPRLPVPGQVDVGTITYRGETVRVATITRTVLAGEGAVPVTVSVAQTRDGTRAIASGLSQGAAALSVALFLLAVGLGAFAARSALRPLNEIAAAVARRGPSDLRPLRGEAPAELAPLLASFNRLMDRLGQAARRSEEFIAEAAHRVRTPLATVRAQTELALNQAAEPERPNLRRVIRAVDESSRSAGQLLDHATVALRADALQRDRVDLADIGTRVAGALEPTAEMKDIDLVLDLAPAPLEGDALLLENAFRNILDNALKYSPPETTITVTLRREDGMARLSVRDEGPGITEDLAVLTQSFRRGAEAESVVGSGLGLTIAQEVADAHGGHLDLQSNGGKGTCLSLVLPAS